MFCSFFGQSSCSPVNEWRSPRKGRAMARTPVSALRLSHSAGAGSGQMVHQSLPPRGTKIAFKQKPPEDPDDDDGDIVIAHRAADEGTHDKEIKDRGHRQKQSKLQPAPFDQPGQQPAVGEQVDPLRCLPTGTSAAGGAEQQEACHQPDGDGKGIQW